jgi:hypothetical protein
MNQTGSTQSHAAGNAVPGIGSLFRVYSAHNQGPIMATDSCRIRIPRSVHSGFQFWRMVISLRAFVYEDEVSHSRAHGSRIGYTHV